MARKHSNGALLTAPKVETEEAISVIRKNGIAGKFLVDACELQEASFKI